MQTGLARTLACLAFALAIPFSASDAGAQTPSSSDDKPITVTVRYTGAGTVDAKHRVWIWMFDTPDIGPEAMPIGEESIEKNGASVTFTAKGPVYFAVAYDEKGGFAGNSPPLSGSPIAIYGVKAPKDQAQPVTPGSSITITFDHRQRMP